MTAARELIVDNFAGGGGASTGIWLATGCHPDIAINHDREALQMHEANHPETKHLCEDVWDVDPRVAHAVREWALANGEDRKLRIALCGYEGEHEMPATWQCVAWKAPGGYAASAGNHANAARERIWFSPHCLPVVAKQPDLFASVGAR